MLLGLGSCDGAGALVGCQLDRLDVLVYASTLARALPVSLVCKACQVEVVGCQVSNRWADCRPSLSK